MFLCGLGASEASGEPLPGALELNLEDPMQDYDPASSESPEAPSGHNDNMSDDDGDSSDGDTLNDEETDTTSWQLDPDDDLPATALPPPGKFSLANSASRNKNLPFLLRFSPSHPQHTPPMQKKQEGPMRHAL